MFHECTFVRVDWSNDVDWLLGWLWDMSQSSVDHCWCR